MYGMVNQAIEEMVVSAHGEPAWLEIKRRAGVAHEMFVRNAPYPDEITYQLVAAASAHLNQPADLILRAFGEHWVLNTARKGYPTMMNTAGTTFGKFVGSLPRFHDRVALIYPNLVPPRFEVLDATEHSLRLHYITHRAGLTPFVEGLLSGLAKMFEISITVTLERTRADGGDTDVFFIEW